MNKKNKKPRKTIKEELQESSAMINKSIAFWEEQMDVVIKKMDQAEEYPDWHPEKTEETYHKYIQLESISQRFDIVFELIFCCLMIV